MCVKTYNSDSEYYVCFDDLEEPIPLCFNTIYYVETPNNEELNNLVQQFFLQETEDFDLGDFSIDKLRVYDD